MEHKQMILNKAIFSAERLYERFKELDKDNMVGTYDHTNKSFKDLFTTFLTLELTNGSMDYELTENNEYIISNFLESINELSHKHESISSSNLYSIDRGAEIMYKTLINYNKTLIIVRDIVTSSSMAYMNRDIKEKYQVVLTQNNIDVSRLRKYADMDGKLLNKHVGNQTFFNEDVSRVTDLVIPDEVDRLHLQDLLTVELLQKDIESSMFLFDIYDDVIDRGILNDLERLIIEQRLKHLSDVLLKYTLNSKRRSEINCPINLVSNGKIYMNRIMDDVSIESIKGAVLAGKQNSTYEQLFENKETNGLTYITDRETSQRLEHRNSNREFINKLLNKLNSSNLFNRPILPRDLDQRSIEDSTETNDLIKSIMDDLSRVKGGGFLLFYDVINKEFVNNEIDKQTTLLISMARLLAVIMAKELKVR